MTMHRLTVYLLRDIETASDALDPEKPCDEWPLTGGLEGAFYSRARSAKEAPWVAYVSPALAGSLQNMTTSSASGLLILKAAESFFAFTFGYGRSLLDQSKIEHRFGLRVALNRIDPRQIRSLDTKTFEDMIVSKATQVSKSSEIPTFGVDVSRDILRAVTGEPRDTQLAKRLSGSDALVINADVKVRDLPGLCEKLLAAYGEETYKENFEWIDHLSLVEDQLVVANLNELLVDQLRTGDTSSTHLAMPETLEWEDVDVFKVAGTSSTEYDDLDLDAYLENLSDPDAITVDLLKSRRVSVRFSRAPEFDDRWTLYKCLVSEQRIENLLHVLIEGRWFAVSESLVADVNSYVDRLSAPQTEAISAIGGEIEKVYNTRFAASEPENLLLLDAKIKRPGGAASGIELCDVLSSSGEFIHVKRKSRSSTLSHLFAQGLVSATTFLGDGVFREEIRSIIEAAVPEADRQGWLDLIPGGDNAVAGSSYKISYVIIANSAREGHDWLPFFSKLNLMQTGKQLSNLGFVVSVSRVDVT